jgi:hypothetical protein
MIFNLLTFTFTFLSQGWTAPTIADRPRTTDIRPGFSLTPSLVAPALNASVTSAPVIAPPSDGAISLS